MKDSDKELPPSELCDLKRVLQEEATGVRSKLRRDSSVPWHWKEFLDETKLASPMSASESIEQKDNADDSKTIGLTDPHLGDSNALGLIGAPVAEVMNVLVDIESEDDACEFEGFTREDVEYARIMGMKMVCEYML